MSSKGKPGGARCPHCGDWKQTYRLNKRPGKAEKWYCPKCGKQFTVPAASGKGFVKR